MTSGAVAVVRAFFDLAAAGDWDFDRLSDCVDPDVVWFGTRGGLDQEQVLRGLDAWIEYMREIEEPWRRYSVEAEQFIDIGDTVVAFLRETAQARQGELELESETAMVFRVRQRKIVEARGYLDRDEATKAAGLTE